MFLDSPALWSGVQASKWPETYTSVGTYKYGLQHARYFRSPGTAAQLSAH